MNIKKKLILTFIYSILWFFLCEATKNTGNIIVFRIVSFSLPIVILLWLVYAFFKLFTFIKRQKYSESRHLIKQLDILIDQRNQKIQSIIYEPVGDGEECQIYLTNQRLVIWKSPVMSINLNTIINTTITENKYFIFS